MSDVPSYGPEVWVDNHLRKLSEIAVSCLHVLGVRTGEQANLHWLVRDCLLCLKRALGGESQDGLPPIVMPFSG